MDLSLLNKLQMSDTVNLILKRKKGDILEYYIINQTVSYSAICSGHCRGSMSNDMACFNIRMSSLVPLINKGYTLQIQYEGDILKFVTEDERVEIVPLYVESRDPNAVALVERYINFNDSLQKYSSREETLEQIEQELLDTKTRYKNLSIMQLSGGLPSNPFTDSLGTEKIDAKFKPQIELLQQRIQTLQSETYGISELSLGEFTAIASVASRAHEIVNFCNEYAITAFKGSYVLQKGYCPVLSINGQLLNTLIRDAAGKGFYLYEKGLVYLHSGKDQTVVFVSKYLPNIDVDQSIVTRGAVEEKYTINLKGILEMASLVKSKFPTIQLDMGAGNFLLTNVNGESITMKFDVEDVKTLQLKKAMRGEAIKGNVVMSVIDIPKAVQFALPLFRDRLVIYVKKNKIIFQNQTLYLVFGR